MSVDKNIEEYTDEEIMAMDLDDSDYNIDNPEVIDNEEDESLDDDDDEPVHLDTDGGDEVESETPENEEDENTEEEESTPPSQDVPEEETGETDQLDGETDEKSEENTSNEDKDDDKLESENKDEVADTSSDKFKASEYDRLLAPFTANKMEMQVGSIDEALQLMKMGVNYQGKMTGLKPHLRVTKMLEDNGLLDESKLNFLIDISKHDVNAITKLIKDSGMNPLDVDVNTDTNYVPKTYTVTDAQVELNDILNEVSDTPSYNETMDIVKTKLDLASRQAIAETPRLISVINEHVASGHYAKIMGEVQKQRILGNLTGLSDLNAYKEVGDRMYPSSSPANEQTAKTVVKAKIPKAESPTIKEQRRAASPTKAPVKATAITEDFSPFDVSDEDFEKMIADGTLNI